MYDVAAELFPKINVKLSVYTMSCDSSESSLDGSLNKSQTSGTSEPAVFISSPTDSVFNMDFGNTSKMSKSLGREDVQDTSVHDMFYEEYPTESHHEMEFTSSSFQKSFSRDPASILADVLPQCNKISSFLNEQGFPSVNLISSDVDLDTQ